jgi:hypothetical protein
MKNSIGNIANSFRATEAMKPTKPVSRPSPTVILEHKLQKGTRNGRGTHHLEIDISDQAFFGLHAAILLDCEGRNPSRQEEAKQLQIPISAPICYVSHQQ